MTDLNLDDVDISVLLSDLKSDVFEYKVQYAKRIGMIALAIGPEKTRNELLASITGYFDVEDEILCIIAEELGGIIPFVGGKEYYKYVLGPLEQLCSVEEVLVAEKAVNSIILTIQTSLSSDTQLEQYFMGMIQRLKDREWFTAKVCVCAIVIAMVKTFPSRKQELLDIFASNVTDPTPMVRQAAAKNLASLIPLLDSSSVISFAIPLLKKLLEDELDFVRFSSIPAIVTLFRCTGSGRPVSDNFSISSDMSNLAYPSLLTVEETVQNVLPLFKALGQDKAWRTRQKAVEAMREVFNTPKADSLKQDFISMCAKFLKDDELEVRIAACVALPSLTRTVLSSESRSSADTYYFKEINPLLKILINDDVLRVREAAASSLPQLASFYGKSKTTSELIPHIKEILSPSKEETTEVKLALLSKIEMVLVILDHSVILELLRTCFEPLSSPTNHWRIRHALLSFMPAICKHMNVDAFQSSSLMKISVDLLWDSMASVREAAVNNLKELTSIYSNLWAKTLLMPRVMKLISEKNYLLRITGLLCVNALASVFGPEDVEQTLLPIAFLLARDPVPNVRLNVVKTLNILSMRLVLDTVKMRIRPAWESMINDRDKDVRAAVMIGLNSGW